MFCYSLGGDQIVDFLKKKGEERGKENLIFGRELQCLAGAVAAAAWVAVGAMCTSSVVAGKMGTGVSTGSFVGAQMVTWPFTGCPSHIRCVPAEFQIVEHALAARLVRRRLPLRLASLSAPRRISLLLLLPFLSVCLHFKRKKKFGTKNLTRLCRSFWSNPFPLEREFSVKFRPPEFERQMWFVQWGNIEVNLSDRVNLDCNYEMQNGVTPSRLLELIWCLLERKIDVFSSLFLSYFMRKWIAFQRWFVSEKRVCCFMKFSCPAEAFLLSERWIVELGMHLDAFWNARFLHSSSTGQSTDLP